MDPTTTLNEARAALEAMAGRTADMLGSLSDTAVSIPGSEWTVRDAAAHLVNYFAVYSEIADGTPSPVEMPPGACYDGALLRDVFVIENARRLADVARRTRPCWRSW